jgi:hypothetical protein
MASYNLHNDGSIAYGHWNDQFVPQPSPNDTVDGSNMMHYAHPRSNTGNISFPIIPPQFSPPYTTPLPLHSLPISQSSIVSQPILHAVNDVGSYNPPLTCNVSIHYPYTAPTAGHSMSTTTTMPTTASNPTPTVVPTASASDRAKFPCPSCGKLCTSRPRAYACLCNHFGAKPFACNGDCGIVGW